MRSAIVTRKTAETDIVLELCLDGTGKSKIDTGCGFLDHMLTLFAAHGKFDLDLHCEGDTYVDDHHSVEDIGIALGDAFRQALGDKRGINRYGYMILPMDEALIMASVDLSGRSHLNFGLQIPAAKVGMFDTELVQEFFLGFTRKAECAVHLKQLDGMNTHHIIEGAFKAFSRALRIAVAVDGSCPDDIPSTKGVL